LNSELRNPILSILIENYSSRVDSLKEVMNLLISDSKGLIYEAIRLMFIIVCKSKNNSKIQIIIKNNKDALLESIIGFAGFKKENEDMVFQKEKKMLITEIKNLP